MSDEFYMKCALELAKCGEGYVNPNPMVGAVIVKNDRIIGQGYHKKYGDLHAEIEAIKSCTQSLLGATMYVTLEPCCHYGKTPPCADAILESGIKRVVIASKDPNPLVSGGGISILKKHGIDVVVGIMDEENRKINDVFFNFIKNKIPFVIMKYAMTMDGKIATASNNSKWITGKESRKNVHKDRNKYSAIMVGVSTVILDNPMLTCRVDGGKNPIRVICDTNLRTPLNSNVVISADISKTIIATSCTDVKEHKPYLDLGCDILVIPKRNNHIDLNVLMIELGKLKIDSVILEGGSHLNFSALESKIVNKVQAYISPKIFGGDRAKTPVGGFGIEDIKNCFKLKNQVMKCFGEDLLIESEVDYGCLQE